VPKAFIASYVHYHLVGVPDKMITHAPRTLDRVHVLRDIEDIVSFYFSANENTENCTLISLRIDLGGLVVSVLTTGPKVRGFDPDRGRWIFKGDKNP
jgi:hypothetical protein